MINDQSPRTKMKTLTQIFTIAALPFWLGGCGGGDGHDHSHGGHGHGSHGAHAEEEAPTEVTLSEAAIKQHQIEPLDTVKEHTLQPTFSVPARVVFNEETTAHVGTLVKGRVSDMKVHLGDTVKKGEVLFIIESPELGQAQNAFLKALDAEAAAGPAVVLAQNNAVVAQAQAEGKAAEAMLALAENPAAEVEAKGKLDSAKPALERAKDLLKSGRELAAKGALADSELKRREAAFETTAAEVRTAEAALAQAKAQKARDLASAKAKAAAAAAGLKAAEAQQAKTLSEAKSALNTAQATVATERNRLTLFGMDEEAINTLGTKRALTPHYTVRAPRAGTVVEREVTLGENVNPSQPHLLILADLSRVWVLMEVPPKHAEGLETGQNGTLVNKETGYRTLAKLDYISPLVNLETRTVQARVELNNAQGQWRPGQFLTALLPAGTGASKTLAVPAEAVQYVDGQPTIYVPTKKVGTFKARPIAIGPEIDGWLPVTKGLKLDEKVVVKGSFVLKAEFGKAGAGHDHSH